MPVDRSLIEAVRDARQDAHAASAKVVAAHDVFNVENAELFEEKQAAIEAMSVAEATLREAALAEYAKNPDNKVPGPGVGIRVVVRPEYDPDTAFAWAKDHYMALSLDRKAFEVLAKGRADGTPEFVTFHDEPQATIATDLDTALKGA